MSVSQAARDGKLRDCCEQIIVVVSVSRSCPRRENPIGCGSSACSCTAHTIVQAAHAAVSSCVYRVGPNTSGQERTICFL